MNILQWIREFRDPALQCERVGHEKEHIVRNGIMTPEKSVEIFDSHPYRAVAVAFSEKTVVCKRCNTILFPAVKKYEGSIQDLSMPSELWRELKRVGLLYD